MLFLSDLCPLSFLPASSTSASYILAIKTESTGHYYKDTAYNRQKAVQVWERREECYSTDFSTGFPLVIICVFHQDINELLNSQSKLSSLCAHSSPATVHWLEYSAGVRQHILRLTSHSSCANMKEPFKTSQEHITLETKYKRPFSKRISKVLFLKHKFKT